MKQWASLSLTLVALCVNGLNLFWLLRHFSQGPSQVNSIQYSYVGCDFPMTLPLPSGDLDTVSLTVEESVHFPLEGAASDQQWFGLTSAGSGYIRLGPDQRLFMVTMFHELHCLRVLNFAYGGSDAANEEHVTHCLGYLRQMALCAADTTLEPDDFTTRDFEVDRMGSTHTCRDWSTVYGVMRDGYDGWMNAGGE